MGQTCGTKIHVSYVIRNINEVEINIMNVSSQIHEQAILNIKLRCTETNKWRTELSRKKWLSRNDESFIQYSV